MGVDHASMTYIDVRWLSIPFPPSLACCLLLRWSGEVLRRSSSSSPPLGTHSKVVGLTPTTRTSAGLAAIALGGTVPCTIADPADSRAGTFRRRRPRSSLHGLRLRSAEEPWVKRPGLSCTERRVLHLHCLQKLTQLRSGERIDLLDL